MLNNNIPQNILLDSIKADYEKSLVKNNDDFLFHFDTILKKSSKYELTDFYRTIGK